MKENLLEKFFDHPIKPKVGFKVVSKFKDEYFSALLTYGRKLFPSSLEYKPYVPTYREPSNGPLAIFESLTTSSYFIAINEFCLNEPIVFSCYYIPSIFKGLWVKDTLTDTYKSQTYLPQGTELAEIVVITEKVMTLEI